MSRDFLPTASWKNLRLRAELTQRVREFFAARGFLAVETPILSHEIVVDQNLEVFSTIYTGDPRRPEVGQKLWLQTSPEAAMKRLLVAGAAHGIDAIYQITRSFRNGERGARHNPEFTMVEWYRTGDDMVAGMLLLDELCQALLERGPARRTTYAEAFARYVEIDPHAASVQELIATAAKHKLAVPPGYEAADRDAWLNLLLAELVEPRLGFETPELLCDYPASQAALAVLRGDSPAVAERFELYIEGIELANGFHELTDADVLRQRERIENAARRADGRPELPGAASLITAMERGLPASTGVALGFDRVVMLAAGAKTIDEVLAFPIERA
jgi:lysyl-tRNA synthetase class 2